MAGTARKIRQTTAWYFPIMQTPFTPAGTLDVQALQREAEFLDRCGTHGMVWPQFASEYASLSHQERLSGSEVIVSTAKRLRPAAVIGVQAKETEEAIAYARHAEKIGADAIIALPPAGNQPADRVLSYYKAIGRACRLPLFAQTVGDISTESVVRMAREIPTLRYVKDEAGPTLTRISWFRKNAADLVQVFTGAHGRTMLDEMERGSCGTMPAASFADLYVTAWNSWQAGKRPEAAAMFARVSLLVSEVQVYGIESLKYILHLRGVFQSHGMRPTSALPGSTGLEPAAALDDEGKHVIREILSYLNLEIVATAGQFRRITDNITTI